MIKRSFRAFTNIASVLAGSTIVAGCVHQNPEDDRRPPPVEYVSDILPMASTSHVSLSPGLCETGHTPVFEGDVQDDFGLSIAVCLREEDGVVPALVSIRYSGEGGTQRVSCLAGQCRGIISLRRYTRYRFTMLTLQWRDENGIQTLSESFDAQDQGGEAKVTVTHSWKPSESIESGVPAPIFPVTPRSAPLQLLTLEGHLLEPDPS